MPPQVSVSIRQYLSVLGCIICQYLSVSVGTSQYPSVSVSTCPPVSVSTCQYPSVSVKTGSHATIPRSEIQSPSWYMAPTSLLEHCRLFDCEKCVLRGLALITSDALKSQQTVEGPPPTFLGINKLWGVSL